MAYLAWLVRTVVQSILIINIVLLLPAWDSTRHGKSLFGYVTASQLHAHRCLELATQRDARCIAWAVIRIAHLALSLAVATAALAHPAALYRRLTARLATRLALFAGLDCLFGTISGLSSWSSRWSCSFHVRGTSEIVVIWAAGRAHPSWRGRSTARGLHLLVANAAHPTGGRRRASVQLCLLHASRWRVLHGQRGQGGAHSHSATQAVSPSAEPHAGDSHCLYHDNRRNTCID